MDWRSALLVTGGSACSFKLLNAAVRLLPTPAAAQKKSWKWRNISTSLAHSSLTGAWSILCFYLQPQMVEDLISSHSLLSHSLVAVSTGYFIHDFVDMAWSQPLQKSWELLLHHSVVIVCFGLAVRTRQYLGFAVVSLLVEINSIFLHIRQLLLLSGRRNRSGTEGAIPSPAAAYRINSWLNLGTFLVFRACTLGWMARWLARQSQRVPGCILTLGSAGLSLISVMNTLLFYRLLRADVLTDTNISKGHQSTDDTDAERRNQEKSQN